MDQTPGMEVDSLWADIPCIVRPMHLDDINEVQRIEQACFPLPWPANAFRYDLTKNENAYYFVVSPRNRPGARSDFSSWWQRLRGQVISSMPPILGYVGYWRLVDEAHIANIAVTPAWRRRGLGELLLVTVLDHALAQKMNVVTLEVRVSNQAARKLYHKFGFTVVGQRRRYYSDNGEDALIMTTDPIASEGYQAHLAGLKQSLAARLISLSLA